MCRISSIAEAAREQSRAPRRGPWQALCALLLLACGTIASAGDVPHVLTVPNAAGWISVFWTHGDEKADHFRVQRKNPAFTWSFEVPTGHHTDMDLRAGTLYEYRVCAGEGDDGCSEWAPQRTLRPGEEPAYDPKLPPTLARHEIFHEPSRVRLWWRKNGHYDVVLVRWRDATGVVRQDDIVTTRSESFYEIAAPRPGKYEVSFKGCARSVNDASCGEWSTPAAIDAAPPRPAPHAHTVAGYSALRVSIGSIAAARRAGR